MTNMITAASIFEELRFVWELFAAELIFLLPFAKGKEKPGRRIAASLLALSVCSQLYFAVLEIGTGLIELKSVMVLCWYLLLVLLSLLLMRYCFSLTLVDTLYMITAGYSAQHIVYVLAHEILAEQGLPLWAYGAASVFLCALLYGLLYLLFAKHLSLCGGRISEDNRESGLRQLGILVILMVSTFTGQHIFENSGDLKYYGALLDCLLCTLVLSNQYNLCRVSVETREKAVLAQMRADSARYYQVSRELIEVVNRKSHDMKHVLNALEQADQGAKSSYIQETRREIEAYQQLVHTDYEALNTILAEKSISCESQQIALECVVTDIPDQVVSPLDLYVLLGNAIDNAMECVSRISDEKKRVITVRAGCAGAFISIQVNNYYEGRLRLQDGFPLTTKSGKYYHGFGLKSIRSIAVKYGGDISIDTENGIFSLQIMIPFSKK